MAWLDDRAWCHPKLTRLSNAAFRTWVSSVCYSAGFTTGGRLENEHQKLVGSTQKVRAELIAAGLWDEAEDGAVLVHDWDDHNDKRDAKRVSDRDRKRKQRDKERDIDRDKERDRRALKEVKVVKVVNKPLQEREPDELWDTLVEELGDVATPSERGKRNSALRELRSVGATPLEVRERCAAYRQKWPHLTLTATALTAHWSALVHQQKPQNGSHTEVDLNLPDLTDEEIAANKARLKAMTA